MNLKIPDPGEKRVRLILGEKEFGMHYHFAALLCDEEKTVISCKKWGNHLRSKQEIALRAKTCKRNEEIEEIIRSIMSAAEDAAAEGEGRVVITRDILHNIHSIEEFEWNEETLKELIPRILKKDEDEAEEKRIEVTIMEQDELDPRPPKLLIAWSNMGIGN